MVGDYLGRPISLFSVIMTSKKHSLYRKVFEKIRRKFPDFVPPNLMTDFEWGNRKALKSTFKTSRVWGCR